MADLQQAVDGTQNTQLSLVLLKLDTVNATIERNYNEMRRELADIKEQQREHDERIRDLEREQSNISAKVTMSQILQTTFATIVAGIAAIVGAFYQK